MTKHRTSDNLGMDGSSSPQPLDPEDGPPPEENEMEVKADSESPQWVAYQPPRPDGGILGWLRRYSFTTVLTLVFIGTGALFFFAPAPSAQGPTSETGTQVSASVEPSEEQVEGGSGSGHATLSVLSTPPNAWVIIEGDTVGRAPLHDHRLQSGAHIVSVVREGYFSRDTVIVLRTDQSTAYTPRLNRTSQPSSTRLYLSRRVDAPGETGDRPANLPTGTEVIVVPLPSSRAVSLANFESVSRNSLVRRAAREEVQLLTEDGRTERPYALTSASNRVYYVIARTPEGRLYESYVNTGSRSSPVFVPGADATISGRMTIGPVPSDHQGMMAAVFER